LGVAEENSVNLHYTNMTGKECASDKLPITEFEIENLKTIKLCSGKHAPFRASYSEEKGAMTTYFSLDNCKQCPFKNQCRVKLNKNNAVLKVDRKSILAAQERERPGCREVRRALPAPPHFLQPDLEGLVRKTFLLNQP
jgi:hypothetical protein